MSLIEELLVNEQVSVKEAIKKLDETAKKILFVTRERELLGTITDGDIRRWILKNGSLEDNVTNIMNKRFISIKPIHVKNANYIMQHHSISAIPVLNDKSELIDIVFQKFSNVPMKFAENKLDNKVVVMAGGKGTRLYPYTQILPKPLIPIGEKSIIEHIFNKFNEYGCSEFILTVNYKKGMIKSYLEELEVPYTFSYVEEENFLGTAGSLYLLKGKMDKTFFVTNCDILIEANYEKIIEHHIENKNKITMVTSITNFTIPYGVVKTQNSGIVSEIEEKPEYNFQINTGVYVLEPEVLDDIPDNTFLHITDLINLYIEQNKKVGVFPIRSGQWQDMGEINLMQNMIEKINSEGRE
ncbi:MAG: nucleotidyltransferase [Epulopiscium sp. Nuni2H_MBin003]|nr:MAG: nucleotidyltransferase [Epulopiscium sp. Nuni2H_MBin003]